MMTHYYQFCVPCIATWKHVTSSLWMNASYLIFWLFCISYLPRLVVLTPHSSPYTSSADYANTFANYTKTSIESTDTTDMPTLDFYVTNSPFCTHGPFHNEITILISIIIVQWFAHHLKFWSQYCFDLKIFHPFFFFIALHLWFMWYIVFIFHLCIKSSSWNPLQSCS